MSELISELESVVKAKLQPHLAERPLLEAASLTWVQELSLEAMRAAASHQELHFAGTSQP